MFHKSNLIAYLALGLSLFVSACAHNVTVKVNSIVNKDLVSNAKQYFILSGMDDISADNLFFLEYRRYFDHILRKIGYQKSATLIDADIQIIFKYGLSNGRSGRYIYSTPIYNYFGGETITVTGSHAHGKRHRKVTTIHVPPRYSRVGTSVQSRSYTYYNRTVSLEALLIYKKTPDRKSQILWVTNIYSIGESNDLRSIMPYLAAAAEPYIANNSGEQQSITVYNNNPSVIELKNLP